MNIGNIQFTLGNLSFTGEGEESWVSSQLDKILKAAPGHPNPQPGSQHKVTAAAYPGLAPEPAGSNPAGGTLAAFLKQYNATEKQSRKFLATAMWLKLQGNSNLRTRNVTDALKQNHQKGLTNASQALANAVRVGYCGHSGKEFFITPEGEAHLKPKE